MEAYNYDGNGNYLYIYNLVAENNQGDAVYLYKTKYVYIYHGLFLHNAHGVTADYGEYIWVRQTNISYSTYSGIVSYYTNYWDLEYSTIYHNGVHGFYANHNTHATIYDNTFRLNTNYAVYLTSTSGYTIYKNVFDRNNGAAGDGTYDSNHIQAYDDESSEYVNFWNTTGEGNCWSDWSQSTPYQLDPSPYVAKDHRPGCNAIPELQDFFVLAVALLLLGLVLRRRH